MMSYLSLEYTFDPSSMTQSTYAARTITAGQELTVSCECIVSHWKSLR